MLGCRGCGAERTWWRQEGCLRRPHRPRGAADVPWDRWGPLPVGSRSDPDQRWAWGPGWGQGAPGRAPSGAAVVALLPARAGGGQGVVASRAQCAEDPRSPT